MLNSYNFSIDWLIRSLDRETDPNLPDHIMLPDLLSKFETIASETNLTVETRFNIYYIFYGYWLCIQRTQRYSQSFRLAKQYAGLMDEQAKNNALDKLYGLINRYMICGSLSKNYYKERYSERPQCFYHNPDERSFPEDFVDEPAQENEGPDEETLITSAFNNTNDKMSFIGRIATNTNLSSFQKAEQIYYCTSSVFEYVYKYKTYSKENWEEFHKILNIEHNILKAALQQDLSNHEAQECDYYLKENFCNHCVVYAALEETENFEQQIRILFKYFCLEAEKILASDSFVGIETILSKSLLYINNVIHRLCCLDEANKLFPCIFELENNFTRILTNSSHNNERILQYIYTPIQESAEHALKEDVPQKETFQKIVQEYEKRIKQISDANFSFKSNDE